VKNIKPLRKISAPLDKPAKLPSSADGLTSKYDPVNNPYKKSVKTTRHEPAQKVSEYDPIDRPFRPKSKRCDYIPPVPQESQKTKIHLTQIAITVTALIPLIILLAVTIRPIGEFIQDFRQLNDYITAQPDLTDEELIEILDRFFQNRNR
jgi:hypothetical protein